MAVGKVHTGDTHTDFQLLVQETAVDGTNSAFDLGDASTIQMVFTDPSETETQPYPQQDYGNIGLRLESQAGEHFKVIMQHSRCLDNARKS